jgi:hypothetical protein
MILSPGPRLAAEEKLIALGEVQDFNRFKVAADGSRLYMAGSQFTALDAAGRMVQRFQTGGNMLVPMPDGWFVLSQGGPPWVGHIGLVRPDGTEAKRIVGKGSSNDDWTKPDLDMKILRADMTGWTSPCAVAVDPEAKLIFAVDTTLAQKDDRHLPDPDWSRIAVFDFDGKYLNDINRYNALARDAKENDSRRTWYNDIEVDPPRKRVYVTARASNELLAFSYDGKPLGKVKPEVGAGAIAVFKDGRVAVGNGWRVVLYDPELKRIGELATPETELKGLSEGIRDLDADASGRLYATTGDRTVAFIRWAADLKTVEAVGGPDYLRIIADFPETSVVAGRPMMIKTTVHGRPPPKNLDKWQAMIRPTDGSALAWRPVATSFRDGILGVVPPAGMRGFWDLAVMLGDGPIELGNRQNVPYVQKTLALVPEGAERSVSVITANARRAFRQGEAIPLVIVRRDAATAAAKDKPAADAAGTVPGKPVTLTIESGKASIAGVGFMVRDTLALEIPAAATRRLAPGRYVVRPEAPDHEAYALALDIAPAEADSPMQRVIYHEMQNTATSQQPLPDLPERMSFQRDWAAAMARMGITRETDRVMGTSAWRHDQAPTPLKLPGFAPAEYYGIPNGKGWEIEGYLDLAVRYGILVDSQILGHCSGVRFRDFWLRQLDPVLARDAFWRARFPSFYGFNYNDEMFFGEWVTDWTPSDVQWLKETSEARFKGSKNPMADTQRYALRLMYDSFDAAVTAANPAAHRTATPMWQFPAVCGSYVPEIYKHMSESYSHFVSEGYHLPWYVPHSAENLRRPGLPLMAVFDPGVNEEVAYAKNAMLMLSRGAQGVGTVYLTPWDPRHIPDHFKVTNELAKIYGPVFAECPPANEAAVLYSYAQDVTERRNGMGTPHWERVFALYGAGLMAGVPMEILYEEDVAAGRLLAGGQPRVPMLFLVGQKEPLPEKIGDQIAAFTAAGGRLFIDADSADYAGAARLELKTHETGPLYGQVYAGDTAWPVFQPSLEKLAAELGAAVRRFRRFPTDTADPWIAKSQFDGGAIRYLMVATEVSPFPWDAGTVWSMRNACYNGQWLPKRDVLSIPAPKGVVYDVFDHEIVKPSAVDKAKGAAIDVDLTAYPGRLYAIAPAALAAPRVATAVKNATLYYRVTAVTEGGKPVLARVPLRIRLVGAKDAAMEIYRGTDDKGAFESSLPLPVNSKTWTLEVTELLGGRGGTSAVSCQEVLGQSLLARPDVEVQREDRIRFLLDEAKAKGGLTLVMAGDKVLTGGQADTLSQALKVRGIELKVAPVAPKEVTPGVYLAAGFVRGNGANLGDMLQQAWKQQLFPYPVSESIVPGPGRGFATAVFAPRGYEENCIALVGGDDAGLQKTVDAFAAWLKLPGAKAAEAKPDAAVSYKNTSKAADVPPVLRLSDHVGVKLTSVTVGKDGKHLLVTASGFHRNLALVTDEGPKATVQRAARVGQTRDIASPWLSADGQSFGASSRVVARFGEGFHLMDAAGKEMKVFASFGDMPPQTHHFAPADDGHTVLAPGTYGLVCWKRDGAGWKEAWAIDYWKEFDKLDWPVSAEAERIPQFQAYIPSGADYALVVFCEFSNNGWVTPEHFSAARLSAVALADGKERWRFNVPVPSTQVWPTLHLSPSGGRMMLQAQLGGWNRETFRFYAMDGGKPVASWNSKTAPTAVAIADGTGRTALAYAGRLLEVRSAQGVLLNNMSWKNQPLSLAFAADGETLLLADDAGLVTSLDSAGRTVWQIDLGAKAVLASGRDRTYAAGVDGRLRCLGAEGKTLWSLDLGAAMNDRRGMSAVVESAEIPDGAVVQALRPANTSDKAPEGENFLATGKATLTLGGTSGWMSAGKVEVKPELLTNGKYDDVANPWLHLNEVFWDGGAGRQVWAEIAFKQPTDVKALTVYENPRFKDSWPTQGLVQVWDGKLKSWNTVVMGLFLTGPVNTYKLNLKGVTKLRYVPWNSYYRNFYTSEIEVR